MAPLGATEYCCLAEEVLVRGISGSKLGAPVGPCHQGAEAAGQAITNSSKPPPMQVAPGKDTGAPTCRTQRPGAGSLHRAASDGAALYCEITRMSGNHKNSNGGSNSDNNSEVEQARCECCGLCEEYTPAYIGRVKGLFCGRWICGLCAEAVKEERHRMGRGTAMEDALQAHMAVCVKFNKIARANPAVHLADAMRQILKKSVEGSHPHGLRSKSSISPRVRQISKASLARSSSCIPAITRD